MSEISNMVNNNINNTAMVDQPRILTGTDDFKKLLLNSDVFIDKSLLIKNVIEDSGDVILIARPRRWGKSLNMDMIRSFLEVEVDEQGNILPSEQKTNPKLFLGGKVDLGLATGREKLLQPLKIAEYSNIISEYQGQFPVISINFKDIKGNNYQEIEAGVINQIIGLYSQYRYLKQHIEQDTGLLEDSQKEIFKRYFKSNLEKKDLKNSLRVLSELLFKHFNQKVYILIDEYDTPINSSYLKFGYKSEEFEQVIELFRSMLGSSLKSNPYLEKGMLTGILRIAKANLFSDLNNVTEYTLLDQDFSKFYGFTQDEVDYLLTKVPTTTAPDKIKDWYNGYTFGEEIIYNPWSIMQCIAHKGKLDYYWLDSGGTGLVDKALLSDDMQGELQELLEGKGIVKKLYKQISLLEIEDNTDIFYSLLVFAGYLNPMLDNNDEEYPRYRLTIPNKEVRNIYVERVTKWVTSKLNIRVSDYDDFVGLLTNQKINQFKQKFSEYLKNSTSYHDLTKEKDYHNLVGGILAPLARKYIIESNKESGYGRFDHIIIPRDNQDDSAIIMEYKLSRAKEDLLDDVEIGLRQIIDKQYASTIKQQYSYIKKIVKIAIAFYRKEIELQYQIDKV